MREGLSIRGRSKILEFSPENSIEEEEKEISFDSFSVFGIIK
jgi:hypothetical protein